MMNRLFLAGLVLAASSLHAQDKAWTLQQCISYAHEHNLTIQQQKDNIQQQEISLNTSKYSRLPDLTGSASESFSFGRALTIDNTYANRNTQSTGFSLGTSAPIVTGGRTHYEIQEKKLNLQAALQDYESTRENVTLNVTSAYLEAICQKDLVQVAENQLELSRAQVHRMELLFQNDKASEADLAQIRSTMASDELSLTQQKNTYMLALLSLSQLLELSTPDTLDVVAPSVENSSLAELPLPDAVYSEALGIKPRIQAEETRLKSQQKAIQVARSALFPSLYFNAGLGTSFYKTSGYESTGFGRQLKDNFNQYFGLSLSVPIFNRFSTRNSIRSARVQAHTQMLQLEQTKKDLYKEIQQAYYNAVAARRQCESSQAALSSAQTAFDLMQRKYENGKATATEFQESKTALTKATANLIQARYTSFFREKILNFYRGEEI